MKNTEMDHFSNFFSRERNAPVFVRHQKFSLGRSHDAVIRVYDAAGDVIETHEHKGDFKEW